MANIFSRLSKISGLSSIEVSSRGTDTVIGEFSVVDDFVKIKHVGGTGHIIIGSHCYLNSGTVIYSGNGVSLGDSVLIGPNCNLVPANHAFRDANTSIRLQGFMPSKGGIIIEDDVWLGANVTVLDGAHIMKGCVVGANSLVKGKLDQYGIYAGVPAKKIGEREQ
jgi:virginiamycin A acetyltransferase